MVRLIELLKPLPPGSKINLIPYNRNEGLRGEWARSFRPSPTASVDAFHERLRAAGLFCTARVARGVEGAAACGMLSTLEASTRRRERRKAERQEAANNGQLAICKEQGA